MYMCVCVNMSVCIYVFLFVCLTVLICVFLNKKHLFLSFFTPD